MPWIFEGMKPVQATVLEAANWAMENGLDIDRTEVGVYRVVTRFVPDGFENEGTTYLYEISIERTDGTPMQIDIVTYTTTLQYARQRHWSMVTACERLDAKNRLDAGMQRLQEHLSVHTEGAAQDRSAFEVFRDTLAKPGVGSVCMWASWLFMAFTLIRIAMAR